MMTLGNLADLLTQLNETETDAQYIIEALTKPMMPERRRELEADLGDLRAVRSTLRTTVLPIPPQSDPTVMKETTTKPKP